MSVHTPLKIAISCYPSVGGSGILATSLGEELAMRGHEVHFISYERPFRLSSDLPNIHFHEVRINDYGLFKYPDYTLPLSVKMAEVSSRYDLDILHVHYAVPHATAAILAQSMLPAKKRPKVVTTLHGTDTTLLAHDSNYQPAIRHALKNSDAVTAVSSYLKTETLRLLGGDLNIQVIYNFFTPRPPHRSRQEVRNELGVRNDQVLLLHSSNLRPVKRLELLLESVALVSPIHDFKLLILAGESFSPFLQEVRRLGLEDRIIVREQVQHVEDYLQAADIGLVTSKSESFCLFALEAMNFACPMVATNVGGIPEVIEDGQTGLLVPFATAEKFAQKIDTLISSLQYRATIGQAAQASARKMFSAHSIVPTYEALYHRLSATTEAP